MQCARRYLIAFLTLIFTLTLLCAVSAMAQVVVATVPSDYAPYGVAVNSTTNKTYVTNQCGTDPNCASNGTVTVINGATLATQDVAVGAVPYLLAVNATTNKIYVANYCGQDPSCVSAGTVTVIDGATLGTTTVNVGYYPYAIAVNATTNKIYVVNQCGNDDCQTVGTVTVIDGATLSTQSVNVDISPYGIAVNPTANKIWVANTCGQDPSCESVGTATVIDGVTLVPQRVNLDYQPYDVDVNPGTNKIYVDNYCGTDPNCASAGTVTVINGATLGTQDVTVGYYPYDVKVNSGTNKIYVVNSCGDDFSCGSDGTTTVIDGVTLNTSTVQVAAFPSSAAVDSTANKIYVVNQCANDPTCSSNGGIVTAIDGATNSTTPVAVMDVPQFAAVNSATNRIYVPNTFDTTVSIIGGNVTLQFVAVPPCRLLDTRTQYGGGGPILGGTYQTFNLPQLAKNGTNCPTLDLSSAAAFSLNPAVVPPGPLGYLTVWPAGESQPLVATMNSLDGRVKANAAIVPAGVSSSISVFASNTTDVVIDIDGYFAPATQQTLAFYTLPPCRVADTRDANQPQGLGPPFMPGGQARDFPILKSPCFNGINSPKGYSFNMTAVPHVPLGYMSVWPTGQSQPLVSTLNAPTGTITANAAIVPAGTGGDIDVYPSNDIDLVIDTNGYFAAPGGTDPLSLYPTIPCRVLDTRNGNGAFQGTLVVDVIDTVCAPPSTAEAYVFNATVVPSGPLGYLTLWPDGQNQPLVATLNAVDGQVTSNMAIVPTDNGFVDAYASNLTQLVMDLFSYFANPANTSSPMLKTGAGHRAQGHVRRTTMRPVHKR